MMVHSILIQYYPSSDLLLISSGGKFEKKKTEQNTHDDEWLMATGCVWTAWATTGVCTIGLAKTIPGCGAA